MDEPKFGFSKRERLQKRHEFLDLYARGEKLHTPHFVLYISTNGKANHRLGITVSRKIGKAAVRNGLKRRLREIFRAHKDRIPCSCDLLVNVKRAAAGASFKELSAAFVGAIERWKIRVERLEVLDSETPSNL